MKRLFPIMLALICACTFEDWPALAPGAVDPRPVGDVSLDPPPPARPRIRMNLDQLETALFQTTGLRWTARYRGETRSQWDLELLGRTLGRPDFAQRVDEDRTVGPVFQKFLDDAARSLCARVIERDLARLRGEDVDPPLDAPLFLNGLDPERDAASQRAAIDVVLRARLTSFHGEARVLEPWQRLIGEVYAATNSLPTAMQAVCVALIVHPDFYSF